MATENILIKFTSDTSGIKDSITEMQKLGKITEEDAKKFQMMEGITEGIADALKEAGIEAKTFSKAVGETDKSTKSLASEINKARNEAVQLSRAYGLSSQEAKNAAKRVAELKEEQDKLNKSIFASDPSKQFQVYSSAVQGVQGAFQAATGALQVFGVENERITKLAQQFQGVLNLTQGINSVLQLKDVYSQLRVVLGVTTAAQRGLNVTEAEGVVATNALTVATTSLSTAGIGALVIGFIGLIGYLSQVGDSFDNTTESAESYKKIQDLLKESTDKLSEALNKLKVARGEITQLEADEAKLLKEIAKENQSNFEVRQKILDSIKSEQSLLEKNKSLLEEAKNSNRESAAIQSLTFAKNVEIAEANIAAKQKELTENDKLIKSINDRYVVELKLLRENAKEKEKSKGATTQNTPERQRLEDLKLINLAERNAFEQSKDALGLTEKQIKAVRELGIEGLKASEEFLGLTDSQIEGLNAIKAYAEGNFEALREYINKVKKEIKDGVKESSDAVKTATVDYTDFNKNAAELAKGLALETFNFLGQLGDNQTQREIDRVEDEKKRGIISEEQYQEKLKKIKLAAAKQDKELAIFSATVALAEALVKALTTKNPPAALILASAIGALNLARIIATPLPRFKEGTLNVGGGNLDADGGMHAVIHKGEAIIPKDRNKDYHPTIKALYNRQIKASEINAFVASKLNGKIENKVTASFDTRKLAKAMDRGNGVQIENAQTVGRIIASELSKGYNRRNIV